MTKLGISYNCFDDSIELLEGSIKSVRSVADFITVVYQTISNAGNNSEIDIKSYLQDLKEKGLIDKFYKYHTIPNTPLHVNELNKRNIGLHVSRENNCTHFMSMDCDEYYKPNELKNALDDIVKNDYDSTACSLQTYWKTGEWVLDPPENYYVSLIYKITPNVNFVHAHPFPVLVDPTRRMPFVKFKLYERNFIEMHHLSYIRTNYTKKLLNSSAISVYSHSIDKLIQYYDNWVEGQPAYMPSGNYHKLKKVLNIFKNK